MNKNLIVIALCAVFIACGTQETSASTAADAVYYNGKIYTVDKTQPWAEAIAVKDGKIAKVGSTDDMASLIGPETKVKNLGGKMVMPGLIDVHDHAIGAATDRVNLSIKNPNDKDAILAEIKTYTEANPDLPYIRGGSWNLGVFEGNRPRKELVDKIVPDRPFFLLGQTGHEAWVNSKTLALLGINADSKQDNRFIWAVDPETGEPTGTINEYTLSLVEQALEPTPANRIMPALAEVLKMFSEHGFTSLKLAEGEITWVQAANLLDGQGKLNARLFPSWSHRSHLGAMTAEQSFAVAARWKDFKTEMVYPRYVKMYADGSSSSHSTLLLEDYADRPGDKGSTSFPIEQYIEDFSHFNKLGLGMIVHVYGDGTSLEMVKAFEAVRERNGDNGIPLHFSHSFMTRSEEIVRLSKISDVCMDFMTLQYPHPSIEGSFVPSIGQDRYQKWLNVKTAVDSGIPFSFGSDWPASLEPVLNGFFQLQAFVTRRNPRDPDYGSLNEGQAISLEQAVRAMTQGGAECLGFDWPDKLGSIEEGKLADFIVIDRNIFTIPIESVQETQVDLTVVGGRVVFDRAGSKPFGN